MHGVPVVLLLDCGSPLAKTPPYTHCDTHTHTHILNTTAFAHLSLLHPHTCNCISYAHLSPLHDQSLTNHHSTPTHPYTAVTIPRDINHILHQIHTSHILLHKYHSTYITHDIMTTWSSSILGFAKLCTGSRYIGAPTTCLAV